MQTSIRFSSLQASYITTSQSALGEEIVKKEANSVPQITNEKENGQKTTNISSSIDLSNQKLEDFQKTIINQALGKVSEIKNEMTKIWEELFSNKSINSTMSSLEDIESLLKKNFSRPTFNLGSGLSIKQGFYQSLEISIQGSIVGKDGVKKDLNININISQSFMQNLQINSTSDKVQQPTKYNEPIDPLVIDYEGNGTELSDVKMSFDLDSDGKKDQISTLRKGSGFLALDKNNDGIINNGNELFGTQSGDGFKDLAKYDANRDGRIDKEDPIYDKLRIWIPNQKGEGELVGLGEKGIGVIYLNPKESQEMMRGEEGDLLGIKQKTADFLYNDGRVGQIHHIDLIAKDNEEDSKKSQTSPNKSNFEALQISANRAYAQNISFHFMLSNTQSEKQTSVSFSQNSSLSLQALSNATDGVSEEISKMWKQLEANFISLESNTQKEESVLEQLLKKFDDSYYSRLNTLIFHSLEVEQQKSIFKSSHSFVYSKLLS
ncbi:hypothetical protein [Helicobacter mesocricetorum]|uniref:hypothetical protein n=1 Tax=Helicobacter mesocricetorum TaxID=87012 RepID=UPI000CF0B2ED|nr:hypothetical protein [Helicobacter mesocricetorum]